jgi:hypothetical protein
MFASYWKVDLLGEPIIGVKAVAIPLNLPPLQLIREDPPIPRGLRITRTGSGGSSLLPGNYYSSWQHWWSKWGRVFFRFPFRQDVLAEGGTAICSYN